MADQRDVTVQTPVGPDKLHFTSLEGREAISDCFEYRIGLISDDLEIAPADLLGKLAIVTVEGQDGKRHFTGAVTEFRLGGLRDGRAQYQATLRPWLWCLSTSTDNRIFQAKSVVDIIEEVLKDYPDVDYVLRLTGSYKPRDYCVQYGETDLNFVRRLMEGEGIWYFFEHGDDGHKLILTDANAQLKPVEGGGKLLFRPETVIGFRDRDCITAWSPRTAVVPGTWSQQDYDFTKPAVDLMAKSAGPMGHTLDGGESYTYPGIHATISRGEALALIRREEEQAPHVRIEAQAHARMLHAGCVVTLEDHPRGDQNDDYIVLSCEWRVWDDHFLGGSQGEGLEALLLLQPLAQPYRPPRLSPHPRMKGPQTAVVVGPAGSEIFTDEYARVKVQFHWDRLGRKDENSTIFVRVSSAWAGAGWGFIQIPRIGQEVIVDFLEGDPDQPIITGRVYNAAQMPPYALPANATQSGWKSNSSPGGGGFNEMRFEDKKGDEEVYFQAEKNHVELVKNDETRTIGHDWVEDVGNDATQSVGHDRTESVANDKSVSVGNNRTVSIGVNDDETVGSNRSLTVGANEVIGIGANSDETIGANHSQTVGASQTLTVAATRTRAVGGAETVGVGGAQVIGVGAARSVTVAADQTHTVGSDDTWAVASKQGITVGSDRSVTVGGMQAVAISKDEKVEIGGTQEIRLGKDHMLQVTGESTVKVGKNLSIEAGDSISLKTGSATIIMKKDGTITIEGKDVTINGSGKINVKASSDVTIKGSKINQN
jgi:type VI secretion system secreted protein VgrG